MNKFEYKVVAAPRLAKKFKGVRSPAERFARTVEEVIAAEAVSGWEYFRADTLPADQKGGLMRKGGETYHTLLIFRRSAPVLGAKKTPSISDPIPAPKWDAPAAEQADDAPKRPSLGAATD
jgi:hypothetical protein